MPEDFLEYRSIRIQIFHGTLHMYHRNVHCWCRLFVFGVNHWNISRYATRVPTGAEFKETCLSVLVQDVIRSVKQCHQIPAKVRYNGKYDWCPSPNSTGLYKSRCHCACKQDQDRHSYLEKGLSRKLERRDHRNAHCWCRLSVCLFFRNVIPSQIFCATSTKITL